MSVHCFQNSVLPGAQWDRNHSAESVSGLPMARTLLQSHKVPSVIPLFSPLPPVSSLSFCDAETVLLFRISHGAKSGFSDLGATGPLSCLIESVGIGRTLKLLYMI